MNARYYLPHIGRFLSADTLVPDPSNSQSFNRYSYVLNSPLTFTDPTGHTCANPSGTSFDPNMPPEVVSCQQAEQTILESTVRIRVRLRYLEDGRFQDGYAISHGTIKDRQYLVTHNHYTPIGAADSFDLVSISLFTADGQEMYSGTSNFITISRYEDAPETLLFDLGFIGETIFVGNGLTSADFGVAVEIGVEKGDEVGQILWDRDTQTTLVGWGEVLEIGELAIDTTNIALKGSSGGGIFHQGIHIANSWVLNENHSTHYQWSTGALNSLTVAE